ncbi:Kinase [Hexamita inflata]|uniref:non-specific serine/threonine protein kinase n=1 Tax=Hexamita inflata TaxID=28002 RepID=A0AA86RK40_9EUKA|nr:Kinase [Hexamita inflata]
MQYIDIAQKWYLDLYKNPDKEDSIKLHMFVPRLVGKYQKDFNLSAQVCTILCYAIFSLLQSFLLTDSGFFLKVFRQALFLQIKRLLTQKNFGLAHFNAAAFFALNLVLKRGFGTSLALCLLQFAYEVAVQFASLKISSDAILAKTNTAVLKSADLSKSIRSKVVSKQSLLTTLSATPISEAVKEVIQEVQPVKKPEPVQDVKVEPKVEAVKPKPNPFAKKQEEPEPEYPMQVQDSECPIGEAPTAMLVSTDDPTNHIELLRLIGQGSFGTVHEALDLDSSEMVAVKVMCVGDYQEYRNIVKEIKFLNALSKHPNAVKYVQSYYQQGKNELWIAMEYCSAGSVSDLMKRSKRTLTEGEAAFITHEMLSGLLFLKEKLVMHRDIKAQNLLVTSEGNIKVSDFGVSAQLKNDAQKKQTFIGTPFWMAPEIILQKAYGFEADIWSVGITVIEMLEGKPPHSEKHPMKAMMSIPSDPEPRLDPSKYSTAACDFVKCCLQKDPSQRLSYEQLLMHEFMGTRTDILDLVRGKCDLAYAASEGSGTMVNMTTNK